MINNHAEREAGHTREALAVRELVEAADEACSMLKMVGGRSLISAPMAAEVRRVELRLWNALYPEAHRNEPERP